MKATPMIAALRLHACLKRRASYSSFVDSLGCLEFLALQSEAVRVITDSGGIQEETTYLGIQCLTLRENTERPVTVTVGTNILIGCDMVRLHVEATNIIEGRAKRGGVPPLWDGKAGERIAAIVAGGDKRLAAL